MFEDDDAGGDRKTKYREARSERGSLISPPFDLEKYRVSRSEKRERLSYLSSFQLEKIPSIEKARNERGSLISSSFDLEKYQVSRKREARGALVSLLLSTLFFNSIDLSSPSWLPYVWRE